jgi:hypothetical protein
VTYRLLEAFKGLFEGKRYEHRDSSLGDWVSYHLFEDLLALGRSPLLVDRIQRSEQVFCVANRKRGVDARRRDGTFGKLVPGAKPRREPGFAVARGQVATVEIGASTVIPLDGPHWLSAQNAPDVSVPTAPAWLQRAGLGADVMGTGGGERGSEDGGR